MGLYQIICDNYLDSSKKVEQPMGLLAKAKMYLANESKVEESTTQNEIVNGNTEEESSNPYSKKIDDPFVFFKNFCEEIGLQKTVLLIPHENQYKAIFSYGVESASRDESVSTFDFWDGTISENKWYSFFGEDLCPFYQLFSSDDAQLLKHLHIKKIEITENTFAILLILEDYANSLIDLETIEIILPNLKSYLAYMIDLSNENVFFKENQEISCIKDKIYSEIAKFNTGFLYTISLQSIFRQLQDSVSFDDFFHIFSFIFHLVSSNQDENEIWYFTEELEIRNVIFAQTEMDLSKYIDNLNNIIKDSFSIENPELEIMYKGNSIDEQEILDFLFSEN